jgi:hypothetical protein
MRLIDEKFVSVMGECVTEGGTRLGSTLEVKHLEQTKMRLCEYVFIRWNDDFVTGE